MTNQLSLISDKQSAQYYIPEPNVRDVFLLGYCELFAIHQKIQHPDDTIIFINDDSHGPNRISLYHAVIQNHKTHRYYDASGLIAVNEDMLMQYILNNYSNGHHDFSIITDEQTVNHNLSIMTGIDESQLFNTDEFNFYILDNPDINHQIQPYLLIPEP